MKVLRLQNLKQPYFHVEDLARVLGVKPASARVIASRYVKAGLLLRLKRDMYVRADRWPFLSQEEKFQLANLLQSPSYISLLTALSWYEISTQIPQDYIESIALKRTKQIRVQNTVFQYLKIKKALYFGFVRHQQFFIAEPEKAFLDAMYLFSLGRYSLDLDAVDVNRLDWEKIKRWLPQFPHAVQKKVLTYESTGTA